MKWVLKEMQPGDMVRVPSGSFYHYAICVSDDSVVQFGDSIINPNADASKIEVYEASIDDFLKGRFAEVAEYDKKELKRKNSPVKIILHAKSCIGRKGYHILHNNCEHFANECVFGEHKSSQTDDFREGFSKSFPMIDIYVCSVDRFSSFDDLPKYAKAELKSLKVEKMKCQKRCVYGLLEYALKNTFSISYNKKSLSKTKRGKPVLKDGFVSFSHTDDLVCVAVSKYNVGVDLEELREHHALDPVKTKILYENEESATSFEEVLELWTKKEAIYKLDDSIEKYVPSQINVKNYETKSVKIEYKEKIFSLSVAADSVINVNFMMLDGKTV